MWYSYTTFFFLSRLKAWWILINIMSMLSQYILYQEFFFFHVCVLNFPDFSKKRRRNWLIVESSVTYQSCQKPGAVPLNTTCTAYSPCTACTCILYTAYITMYCQLTVCWSMKCDWAEQQIKPGHVFAEQRFPVVSTDFRFNYSHNFSVCNLFRLEKLF